jgi:hypothetical protein
MVRIFSLIVILFCLLVSQAFAISPINLEVIKEAQEYGKTQAQSQLKDFLLPWMSYEEKAVKLDDTAERSYLYTSFLLMATDAREKSLNGHVVKILDSENILSDYSGLLSFSTVLYGDKQDFMKSASVTLKQDKKVVKAYQVIVPPNAEKISMDGEQNGFTVQCYFYFLEKDIRSNNPIILSITTNDKKEHNFYFDMAKIK